ncbi:MAG: sodium:proton antiporter NhaD [Prevotellaceae bacterium]|jgi:Na+/H+ antiporter NhaD/arsenite permease-like protein|nr:sodium:proton antiporter NhaD [Prevotellaceae bacterium]
MVTILIILFLIGYSAIVFEHFLKINKAGTALCMGALCWTVYILLAAEGVEPVLEHINEELGSIASVLFFLLGAMTIVEVIDAHDGFRFITDKIRTTNKRKLLWIIAIITFFLSAVLDNLTTTIVMVSLLGKLIGRRDERLLFISMVIIAANAGGAWTPMGDVTTTMLWIGKQVTTGAIISKLFLPSVVSMIVPLAIFSFMMKGTVEPPTQASGERRILLPPSVRTSIFFLGILILLCVPVFKAITHLPPYVGMILGVGILWIYTGILYRKHHGGRLKQRLSVTRALHQVEISTILFFLGILLCIGALQHANILSSMAAWLDSVISSQAVVVTIIGIVSAIVDNVPLVAAAQGMYSFPTDHFFWEFLAYAAGTGGSMLIVGSAAGVAAMGIEKINFIWYLKRISGWALLGYLAGAATYIVEDLIVKSFL